MLCASPPFTAVGHSGIFQVWRSGRVWRFSHQPAGRGGWTCGPRTSEWRDVGPLGTGRMSCPLSFIEGAARVWFPATSFPHRPCLVFFASWREPQEKGEGWRSQVHNLAALSNPQSVVRRLPCGLRLPLCTYGLPGRRLRGLPSQSPGWKVGGCVIRVGAHCVHHTVYHKRGWGGLWAKKHLLCPPRGWEAPLPGREITGDKVSVKRVYF